MNLFITGPSGVGKTYFIKTYCEIRNLSLIKSITTRPKRHDEEEFHRQVSKYEFNKLLTTDKLCMVAENHGYFYGYLKNEIIENPNGSLVEVDSGTAVKEQKNFNASILRVLPSINKQKLAILNIYEKRDFIEIRLKDFYEQIDQSFLDSRIKAGETIIFNDFDKRSLLRFIKAVDFMRNKEG